MYPYDLQQPMPQYAAQAWDNPVVTMLVTKISDPSEVEHARVPLDGRSVYFVTADGKYICRKFIDTNGNAVIRKYVLQEEPSDNNTIEVRLANLEALVAKMGVTGNEPNATTEPTANAVQPVHE